MKKKLVLKKILISSMNAQKLVGGTGGGNSLDDETNTNPTYISCPDSEQPNCSADPRKCMVDPLTHPY